MRRMVSRAALLCAGLLATGATTRPSAHAAPVDATAAAQRFDQALPVDDRLLAQIFLISAGYSVAVPMEHFNTYTLKAILAFQARNGFPPDGQLDKPEVDRLIAEAVPKLAQWGFRKVAYPGRTLAIWAPLGLGFQVKENGSGLHFRDPRGRVSLDMVSLPGRDVGEVFRGLLADRTRDGSDIHFKQLKEGEGWFALSSTSLDGADHYYRYHQDGGSVTGFALEWNNAVENVNAERIAVIMSGSLRAAMLGDRFVDPPLGDAEAQAQAPPPAPSPAPLPPVVQPTAVPVPPPPPPEPPKNMFHSGTGFFVAADGHLVTNAHVVEGCSDIAVKTDDGGIRQAQRVATDATNDLALLKVGWTPSHTVALRVGTRLGEGVEAFGYPHSDLLASTGNFTLGNVTALSGLHDDSRFLQISVPVQAGNSGGPLLDSSGNLVGVVTAKLDAVRMLASDGDLPQNVNFAVKSAMVADFLDANRVAYRTGAPSTAPLAPADIADAARAVSVFVVCR